MRNRLLSVFTYCISVFLLTLSVFQFSDYNWISGLLLLLAGVLALPAFHSLLRNTFSVNISSKLCIPVVVIFSLLGLGFQTESQKIESAERNLIAKQEKVEQDSIAALTASSERLEKQLKDSLDHIEQTYLREEERRSKLPLIGENGIIEKGGIGAVDEKSFDEFFDLAIAKDNMGIDLMAKNGLIVILPETSKVLMIDIGFTKSRVRIQTGVYKGESLYVLNELIKSI